MKIKLTYLIDVKKKFNYHIIQKWIKRVIESEGKKLGIIEIVFTSNKHLLEINQEFLKHNYFTDVIAFGNCVKNLIQGDIFISLEQVTVNSVQYKVTFEQELLRVMVHGVLHLIGYRDDSLENKLRMKKKEDEYMLMTGSIKEIFKEDDGNAV